jgi:NDP-sugar pyrophosphorylase family protein
MPIGEYPILEIMIRQMVHHGFWDITITVGHLGHLIKAVCGDGTKWGARIQYLTEGSPRGTIGAVADISGLEEPFLVVNGDLLTDFSYREFFDAHCTSDALVSIGVFRKQVPLSLGVLELDSVNRVVAFQEKPVLTFHCSMGIYAFDPAILQRIPRQRPYGFEDLMRDYLRNDWRLRVHPFDGIWFDIGQTDDHQLAVEHFERHRARIVPRDASPPALLAPTTSAQAHGGQVDQAK